MHVTVSLVLQTVLQVGRKQVGYHCGCGISVYTYLYCNDWLQLFCACVLPKLPLGQTLLYHEKEACCIYVKNVGPWNVFKYLSQYRWTILGLYYLIKSRWNRHVCNTGSCFAKRFQQFSKHS